jgi:hypothetical protein
MALMDWSGHSEISKTDNLDRTKRILPELVTVEIEAVAFKFETAEG